MPISNILDLSTAHIPPDLLDRLELGDLPAAFGQHRAHEHEYGYLVFIPGGFSAEDLLQPNIGARIEDAYRGDYDTPEWLLPMMVQAVLDNCVLVLFDQDADVDPRFHNYYPDDKCGTCGGSGTIGRTDGTHEGNEEIPCPSCKPAAEPACNASPTDA